MDNKLLDFLQGASNAAASNVSAPVDGLAWLLRKAGVNVGDAPMGGSDWMRAKGLTAEPRNRLAGILGESLGGVAPMLAAARAPQIANGLLKMGENAMVPQALSKQAGAVYVGKDQIAANAYHGSGSEFSRLSDEMLGSAHADQNGAYWLTDDWGHARGYSVSANPENKTKPIVKEGNVFFKNPAQVDAMAQARSMADEIGVPHPHDWGEASQLLDYNSWVDGILKSAKKAGNDGVIIKNTGDAPGTAGGLADHYAVFNKNRVRFKD